MRAGQASCLAQREICLLNGPNDIAEGCNIMGAKDARIETL